MSTQTAVKTATVADFRRNLEDMRIPKGAKSMADYERTKRLLGTWLREVGQHGMSTPSYESLIRVVADWVGV